MPPLLVIVGPPGSGKSTAARLVAERLATTWRETDVDVEETTGSTISDIFVEQGEDRFRELERAAVRVALSQHDGVLAIGGGAILDSGTRQALIGATVVFLDVGIKAAASRVGLNRDRPLLLGNPRAQWTRLMEQRRGFYEQVATFTVATDDRTPDEVADEIVRTLG
jgi:shikimate kinase